MSFAHFNEILEICNGLLKKDEVVVKTKPRMKKRYVMKSRPVNQRQKLKDAEDEYEKKIKIVYFFV